jgi:hypothetical protein
MPGLPNDALILATIGNLFTVYRDNYISAPDSRIASDRASPHINHHHSTLFCIINNQTQQVGLTRLFFSAN